MIEEYITGESITKYSNVTIVDGTVYLQSSTAATLGIVGVALAHANRGSELKVLILPSAKPNHMPMNYEWHTGDLDDQLSGIDQELGKLQDASKYYSPMSYATMGTFDARANWHAQDSLLSHMYGIDCKLGDISVEALEAEKKIQKLAIALSQASAKIEDLTDTVVSLTGAIEGLIEADKKEGVFGYTVGVASTSLTPKKLSNMDLARSLGLDKDWEPSF